MKNLIKIQNFRLLFFALFLVFSGATLNAQSTSIDFPTGISTSEISGKIAARDLGDARLTTYYYTFDGTQGDIFINVSAANFTGDVDIYIAENLRPLSKISFYGDAQMNETGRVIYLRKPERLILRIQGRTPDDNAATFKVKFAGSFVAVENSVDAQQPKLPEIDTENNSGIRVNSVGTIIETKSKATAGTKTTTSENTGEKAQISETEEKAKVANDDSKPADSGEAVKSEEETSAKGNSESASSTLSTAANRTTASRRRNNTRRTAVGSTIARRTSTARTAKTPPVAKTETTEPEPNPLENVRMIVLMKDGEKIEFPMTEVFRFSMTGGVLTITTKDGKIQRRPLLDIQKMSIE